MLLKKGFTLIEVLLVITLVAIIALASTPVLISFKRSSDLVSARDTVVTELKFARSKAVSANNDTNWGLYVQNGSTTVYSGNTYVTRDSALDNIAALPVSVGISGNVDINFQKLTGAIASDSTITLSISGNSKQIQINAKGTISY